MSSYYRENKKANNMIGHNKSIFDRLVVSLPDSAQSVLAAIVPSCTQQQPNTISEISKEGVPHFLESKNLTERLAAFNENPEVHSSNFYKGMLLADLAVNYAEGDFEQGLLLAREASKLDAAAGAHAIGKLAVYQAQIPVFDRAFDLAKEALALNSEEGMLALGTLALTLTQTENLPQALELVEEIKRHSNLYGAYILKDMALTHSTVNPHQALQFAEACYQVDAGLGQEALLSIQTIVNLKR